MKTTSLTMTLLYDYYGELLTEKQRTCFDLYYNQDLSLSEIAENEGISRQGVHDSILRAENLLRNFEEKIGCVARASGLQQALQAIRSASDELEARGDPDSLRLARTIRTAADSIE